MTTTLIDRRPAPRDAAEEGRKQAAHDIMFTAMVLALATIVAVSADDETVESLIAKFEAQCDKLGAQSGVPAIALLVTKNRTDLVAQLRDLRARAGTSEPLPYGYNGG